MSEKLNVLFLSSWYPSRVFPSNGNFVQRHAEAVATKHCVTVIHLVSDEKIKSVERISNVIKNVNTIIVYIPKTNNPIKKFLRFFKYYKQEISKTAFFDIIHLNVTYPVGIIALYLKIFRKIPYIISEHSSIYQPLSNKAIKILKKFVIRQIINFSYAVCPVSNNLGQSMRDLGFEGRYCCIPNVVNCTIFKTSNFKTKEFTITHISNMDNGVKNITDILKTVKNLQDKKYIFKFNLIGNNSDQYIPLIEEMKLTNINIVGQISHKKVSGYFKKSDLFVLFSNYENLPCVILEAFSSGVPVVSTNVGGISEYFPKDFGYLIEPKDNNALEEKIVKIYNKTLNINKKSMHKYAVDNFGVDKISNSFSELYYEALEV